MNLSILLLSLTMVFVIFANPAISSATESWQSYLSEAKVSVQNGDCSYALYKLRKAWLAVPDKELSAPPYKDIREILADAIALSPSKNIASEERLFRDPDYAMDKIDRRFKLRESYSQSDEYSVEYRQDGSLAFTRRDLDKPYTPAGICLDALSNISSSELARFKAEAPEREKRDYQWYAKYIANIRARMPVVYKPDSFKYQELLALCQPIKKGEKKMIAGFDFNPFLPLELQTLSDF